MVGWRSFSRILLELEIPKNGSIIPQKDIHNIDSIENTSKHHLYTVARLYIQQFIQYMMKEHPALAGIDDRCYGVMLSYIPTACTSTTSLETMWRCAFHADKKQISSPKLRKDWTDKESTEGDMYIKPIPQNDMKYQRSYIISSRFS